MSFPPRVSVVMPVWNGARFLSDALGSIRAQNYEPLEIILVDDGSTDESAAIGEQHGVRVLRLPHRGLTPTRLSGIEAARGEVLAFLDCDDVWAENKLNVQLKLLAKNSDTMIVNGYTQLLRMTNDETLRFEKWGEPVLAPSFGSALFRREALERLGLINAKNSADLDLDWFMPARELGISMLIHDDIVQYYRRHDKNMTNDQRLGKQSLLMMLYHSLERRKELGLQGKPLPTLRRDQEL